MVLYSLDLYHVCLLQFMLESPRYLLQKGNVEKATKVLARVSSWGKRELPPGRLVTQDEKEDILKREKDNPSINTSYDVPDEIITSTDTTTKHQSYGAIGGDTQVEPQTSEQSPLLHPTAKVSIGHVRSYVRM